jgi:hypothetical protein
MVNVPYDQARYWFVTASLDWPVTDLVLVAWAGTPNFVKTDKKVSDIVARGVTTLLGFSLAITEKGVAADGAAQTNDVVIPDVPIGPALTHFTMCRKNATPNLSELILFVDDAEGLPFTPNGLDIEVTPDWLQQRGWFYG